MREGGREGEREGGSPGGRRRGGGGRVFSNSSVHYALCTQGSCYRDSMKRKFIVDILVLNKPHDKVKDMHNSSYPNKLHTTTNKLYTSCCPQ